MIKTETSEYTRLNPEKLKEFCTEIFIKNGVSEEDARVTSDVLITADLRGINSHGAARLKRYVDGLENGMMKPAPEIKIIRETPVSAVIDAGAGLGQPVSFRAMKMAIEKAEKTGVGMAAVRNSNHYGIAGYYSMMALKKDMIGFSTTNSAPMVIPTYARIGMMGTNPLSVAIPAGNEKPFVLDMATSVVPRGKLEVYDRRGMEIPTDWAADESGLPTNDPGRVLKNILNREGGGLFPLGGEGEALSGHKGYGLAMLVEILSGVLSGAAYADDTYPKDKDGNPLPSKIGHFFGAVRVDLFRDVDEFKEDMDRLIIKMKNTKKAPGQDRVYVHGEKEFEKTEYNTKNGVPVHKKAVEIIKEIGEKYSVSCDF